MKCWRDGPQLPQNCNQQDLLFIFLPIQCCATDGLKFLLKLHEIFIPLSLEQVPVLTPVTRCSESSRSSLWAGDRVQARGWRETSAGRLPLGTQFLCCPAHSVLLAYWAELPTWPATSHFLGLCVPHPCRLSWVGWHGWHHSLGAIVSPILPLLSRILKAAQCPNTFLNLHWPFTPSCS